MATLCCGLASADVPEKIFGGIEEVHRIPTEKRKALREALERIALRMTDGCTDTSCKIRGPGGQGTNGGCRCSVARVTGDLEWIANELRSQVEG